MKRGIPLMLLACVTVGAGSSYFTRRCIGPLPLPSLVGAGKPDPCADLSNPAAVECRRCQQDRDFLTRQLHRCDERLDRCEKNDAGDALLDEAP